MTETIDWQQWSRKAFARARDENKPILLSLVTVWSEGCATMDRTTFSHPEVVASVRSQFVPIRVDADRRPDLNERYNLGGWPTTVFLTAEGDILNGGTYVEAEQMVSLLQQVSEAWRDRRAEILARAGTVRRVDRSPSPASAQPSADTSAPAYLRALMVAEFDSVNGGFGVSPKFPHTSALTLALSLDGSLCGSRVDRHHRADLRQMQGLWDPVGGGFFRYADAPDWSRPGTEKTLETNAALLHLYVEAAIRCRSDEFRDRAVEIVRWVRGSLADQADGGFYNAVAGTAVDRSVYVDRNAEMVSGFLRAAALFEDPWLRDFALRSLETVILPGYAPGGGVGHTLDKTVTGLLTDQIRVGSALVWAHAITGQLPYSMLAAELMQFAIRTMWDEQMQGFRDRASVDPLEDLGLLREPVIPFELNCEAACVLDRLATLTGDRAYRDRAVAILESLASQSRCLGLFGSPYALAVREVIDRQAPLGLELAHVEWHLGTDS